MDYNYGDIIEYIDTTRDLNFEAAQKWAFKHNVDFTEQVEKREEKEGKLYRYFQIGEEPVPYEPLPPTKEEQEQNRAFAYQQEVDPITSHIQRLRDMEQTEEIIAEIEQLIIERDAKVEEIKARYPYPVDNSENLNYNNAELTL